MSVPRPFQSVSTMSRTARKQPEWTLRRSIDDMVAEGAYPLASDDIVVHSVEERIHIDARLSRARSGVALMQAAWPQVGQPHLL